VVTCVVYDSHVHVITAPARLVMCDMLIGSVERIIQSNLFLRLLKRVRVTELIVHKRQISYTVVTPTGHSEQFEQVLFNTRPLRLLLKASKGLQWLTAHSPPASTIVAVAMTLLSPSNCHHNSKILSVDNYI